MKMSVMLGFQGDGGSQAKEKTHNPRMSAGCQRPVGTAIKSACRERLGWAVGGLVRNKTMHRVTAEALRREAVSAPGSQRTSCCHSLAASEPRQARRQQPCVHSKAAFPRVAFRGAPEQPGWSWLRRGAIGQARNTSGMKQGQSPSAWMLGRGSPGSDGNESAQSAEGCLSRIFGGERMRGSWSGHGHSQLCKQPRREGDLPCIPRLRSLTARLQETSSLAHRQDKQSRGLFPSGKLLSHRSESEMTWLGLGLSTDTHLQPDPA